MTEMLRSKHSSNRKYGRCNHEFNVCVHLDGATGVTTFVVGAHTYAMSSRVDADGAVRASGRFGPGGEAVFQLLA